MTAAEAELAPAKINLALHVTGRRADGYHLLDSLVVFAGFGDVLTAEPADALTLTVSGPFAEGVPVDGTNLVLRAAEALCQARGRAAGAAIRLHKELPHGAGLGGGSSDAAAAIRMLARMWGVAPLSPAEAVSLGADVPVCLMAPAPTFMSGIGEVLRPAPKLPPCWIVLANNGVLVPTARVFARFDAEFRADPKVLDPVDAFPDLARFEAWLFGQRNDLTQAATHGDIAPGIEDVLEAFTDLPGCLKSDMSGSGGTCWGLFGSAVEAEAAVARLIRRHPGWWVRMSKL